MADLIAGRVALEWVPVHLISDDPAKGMGRARSRDLLFAQLMRLIASPERTVDIVSAYFVPGRRFTQRLVRLAGEGKRVRILTNSQEATDVLVVHSAYVKYRPALIDGGVALYELRATPAMPREPRVPGTSTRASLHSKSVSVDGQRLFIGSFNFDPRSAQLNTEMGVVFDHPALAAEVKRLFDAGTRPESAWRVTLDAGGALRWLGEGGQTWAREPEASAGLRALVWLLSWLPIESQL